jgi:hypothetical protein
MGQESIVTQKGSDYNQSSFLGGMSLLGDDTRLQPNQYRILFNSRNRYDKLDLILSSAIDKNAPPGVKQEMVSFGNYLILFVKGKAYYKLYTDTNWAPIVGFAMDPTAPRYWTVGVPVAETNYFRIAASNTISIPGGSSLQKFPSVQNPVNINNVRGAAQGNLPGLLVQDGINQPQFIFLDGNGFPVCRVTQRFDQWAIGFNDPGNTLVTYLYTSATSTMPTDFREYVPIGKAMAFVDGILYIASVDGNLIYRSVSGRPLDFVVNVSNLLATTSTTQLSIVNYLGFPTPGYWWFAGGPTAVQGPDTTKGGDATTTAYSVGAGPITVLRGMSDGSLFVGAGNANFSVAKNKTPNAPTMFGEYTFLRTFLFNAVCLSDRAILDSLGDTRFISLTGIRSFNAVEQAQNEGRNSVFTATIQPAFTISVGNGFFTSLVQDASFASCILFDNYELYAVNTIFGPAIAVFDTVNGVWTGFDVLQTNGKRVKQLVKIELTVQALFAITEDDQIYRLYVGPGVDTGEVRTIGVCSNILYANQNIRLANPKMEIKLQKVRVIINGIVGDCQCTVIPYVNNRLSQSGPLVKPIKYSPPVKQSVGSNNLPDINTQLVNLLFTTPAAEQGWKTFCSIKWTGGSLTQFSFEMADQTPLNPLQSQGLTQ